MNAPDMSERPDWLRQEEALLKAGLPNTHLIVVYANELPHYEEGLPLAHKTMLHRRQLERDEKRRFDALARDRGLAFIAAFPPEHRAAGVHFANEITQSDDPGFFWTQAYLPTDDYQASLGFGFHGLLATQRFSKVPHYIVIVMGESYKHSPEQQLAVDSHLHADDTAGTRLSNLYIPSLWHEGGHLKLYCSTKPYNGWQHEKGADESARQRLYEIGGELLAEEWLRWRASINLFNGMRPAGANYHTILAQQGHELLLSGAEQTYWRPMYQNVAAALEMQQRAAAYMKDTSAVPQPADTDFQQLESCFNAKSHRSLRRSFGYWGQYSMRRRRNLMHALGRVVEDNRFTLPGARELSQFTYESLQFCFPAVLAEPKNAARLRDKPLYLAP